MKKSIIKLKIFYYLFRCSKHQRVGQTLVNAGLDSDLFYRPDIAILADLKLYYWRHFK